eukprot:8857118-Pyramimonas_sp.AAC.1
MVSHLHGAHAWRGVVLLGDCLPAPHLDLAPARSRVLHFALALRRAGLPLPPAVAERVVEHVVAHRVVVVAHALFARRERRRAGQQRLALVARQRDGVVALRPRHRHRLRAL